MSEAEVAALLRERAGYERRGLKDRTAAVNARLRELGHTDDAPVKATASRQQTRKK